MKAREAIIYVSGMYVPISKNEDRKSLLVPMGICKRQPREQMQNPQTPNLVHRYPNANIFLRVNIAPNGRWKSRCTIVLERYKATTASESLII